MNAAKPTINDFLELHAWTVFDVDDEGRVLAGSDASGSMQLVEIDGTGTRRPLTALPGACSGRYVPRSRMVVVQHDTDGNERAQLSLISADRPGPAELAELEPLVHDPEYLHMLVDVTEDAVIYSTNRRNNVDFDVVVRRLADGAERVVYDSGGLVNEVDVDGETVAVTLLSLLPASTHVRMVRDGALTDITDPEDHASHHSVRILPGSRAVLMASNHDRDFQAVVRVEESGEWATIVAAHDHDVSAIPAPDASGMLVIRNLDGAHEPAVHEMDGRLRTRIDTPRKGVVTAMWSPGGAYIAIGVTSPTSPGDVLLVDATSGDVHTLVDGTEQMIDTMRNALVEPTSVRIPARDGESIPCYV